MNHSDARGFTLIEVTIVLMVLAIFAAVLLPSIGGFNSLARGVRLKEDLGVRIGCQVARPGELDSWTEINVAPKLKRFRDER